MNKAVCTFAFATLLLVAPDFVNAINSAKSFSVDVIEKQRGKQLSQITKLRSQLKNANKSKVSTQRKTSKVAKKTNVERKEEKPTTPANSQFQTPIVDPAVTISIATFVANSEANIEIIKSNAEVYNDSSHQDYYRQMLLIRALII